MPPGLLRVIMSAPHRVLFDGTAGSVTCPGEQGTFEVLPLHRPLVSRLEPGVVVVDASRIPIRRGLVRVVDDVVMVAVELPEGMR